MFVDIEDKVCNVLYFFMLFYIFNISQCVEFICFFVVEFFFVDYFDYNDVFFDSVEDVFEFVFNILDIGDKFFFELIKRYQLYMGYNVDCMCDVVLDFQNIIGMKIFVVGVGLFLMGQKMEEILILYELFYVC